ncbi:FHA domain-containing protein [Nocardia sienata]|uniref:FHA domain-containing protein n=1 Tax=Nocardia sienata TaxID=248552 RepID=UPI0007A3E9FE|nr:FHA domain-containing protein [Nocardia sienata]
MRDQQVEVVAGAHAAARVAGAVVLVAHRGTGRPTENAPAVRALAELAELVHEAVVRRPESPGALIAREATRWLMAQADRTSHGTAVYFGILSAAGPDRVAIFLHGAVTAILDGAGSEYFHGRDAVFTVDRAAAIPDRAVALFVDDTGDPDEDFRPVLPATRGIGRLVEGIAEAGGVIAWTPPPDPGATTGSRVMSAGARTTPEPAAESEQTGGTVRPAPEAPEGRSAAPVDPDAVATAVSTPLLDTVELSERGSGSRGVTGDPETPGRPRNPAPDTDPHRARTEISGRQPPRGAAAAGPGSDETADSRKPEPEAPHRTPAHPTPRRHQPYALSGPPERGTPPLDPELRRRTEATAKGTALTVKVMGFKCARAHPTDPRAAFCSVCGMPVDQTQPLIEVVRPPLGILVLDDGATYLLETDSVLGRDPEHSEPARRGLTPLPVVDNSGGMSRAHAELLLVNWDVTLVDRGSTNGTRTRATGFRDWVRVPPRQPVVLVPGTEILIGQRMLRYESAAPPPFGL